MLHQLGLHLAGGALRSLALVGGQGAAHVDQGTGACLENVKLVDEVIADDLKGVLQARYIAQA